MKNYLYLTAFALLVLSGCSTYQNTAGVYEDDLYYTPSDKPISIAESYSALPAPDKKIKEQDQKTFSQLKDTYQESPLAEEHKDLRDFSSIQNEYTSLLTNDSIAEVDTLVYYNDQTGYWVNEFSGSQMDKDYAERIAGFHGPMYGIPYWSPLYEEVIFGSGFNYNVYIEGDYAFVVPNWSSSYYWDWRYSRPYHHGFYGGFGWNYGWNSWGFGIGYGYNNWYNPYYSWGYPYDYGYWGHHHHHYYPSNSYYARERAPRQIYTNRLNRSSQVSTIKSRTATSRTDLGRTSRTTAGSNRSTATGRTTRASYNPQSRTTTSSTTKSTQTATGRNTRNSSYTPTYTRPTYNSSGTRNSYNTSTRSTSSRSTTNSNNSNSSSSKSYNTGSSSRRTSTNRTSSYNNRSSSSSSRSYTPSYSSGSRSSSSSSSSYSGSSSRSSSRSSSSGTSRSSSSSSSRSSSSSSRSRR